MVDINCNGSIDYLATITVTILSIEIIPWMLKLSEVKISTNNNQLLSIDKYFVFVELVNDTEVGQKDNCYKHFEIYFLILFRQSRFLKLHCISLFC